MVAPGYVLGLAMPAVALQTPLWAFHRRMDFFKQRVLQAFDPVTGLVVTVTLAVAGMGYWALVVGTLAGAWGAAIAAVLNSPYRLRFRYERGAVREYASFSWPIFIASANGVLVAQIPVLVAQRSLGIAAVGVIALASSISLYASRIHDVITHAIYPAVCAVKDRADLMFEAFSKSNRLALLWGMPCGTALALFASDLVHYVLGEQWDSAIVPIAVFGLTAAPNQAGFNWSVFCRARGETRPMAVSAAIMMNSTLGLVIPLMLVAGVDGFAIGVLLLPGAAARGANGSDGGHRARALRVSPWKMQARWRGRCSRRWSCRGPVDGGGLPAPGRGIRRIGVRRTLRGALHRARRGPGGALTVRRPYGRGARRVGRQTPCAPSS